MYRVLTLLLLLTGGQAQNFVPGELFLQLRPDVAAPSVYSFDGTNAALANIEALKAAYGLNAWKKVVWKFHDNEVLDNLYAIYYRQGLDSLKLMKELGALPEVVHVERNMLYPSLGIPYYPDEYSTITNFDNLLYYLNMVNAYEAWGDHHPVNNEVVIAIVDNGTNYKHEDLKNNLWQNPGEIPDNQIDDDGNGKVDDVFGWDTYDDDANVQPKWSSSHGTHVAGIAGGQLNNAMGVAGTGFNPKLMLVKGSNDDGSSGIEGIWSLAYALQEGAEVVSMSFGHIDFKSTFQETFMRNYANLGVIFVAGAGNNGLDTTFYPATYTSAIAVAACAEDTLMWPGSNYADWVDIVAPGVNMISTGNRNDSDYLYMTGTSMATPVVSGVVALMKSYRPEASRQQIIDCLLSSTYPLEVNNALKYTGKIGTGLVQADAALQCLKSLTANEARSSDELFTVYPNPGSDYLKIASRQYQRVEVVDIEGQIVFEHDGLVPHVDTSQWADGIYTCRLFTDLGVLSRRWLKMTHK